jgi:hypothetical protein
MTKYVHYMLKHWKDFFFFKLKKNFAYLRHVSKVTSYPTTIWKFIIQKNAYTEFFFLKLTTCVTLVGKKIKTIFFNIKMGK